MTLADAAREAKVSPAYLNKVWAMLTAPGEDVGPLAALQARWKSLPPPDDRKRSAEAFALRGGEPDGLRQAAGWMRDLIVDLRPRVAMSFDNLPARGIAAGSQSLVLWKDRQYADHRTTYPGNALKLDMSAYAPTDPALLIPETDEARARYDASFTRFCALFPDKFYVSERGRIFLTNPREIASDAQGHRLLSAGFHSQMGYFRDDRPLYEMVLDTGEQRQLDDLWRELDFVTHAPVRQFKQFIWFERAEPPSFMATAQFNTFRSGRRRRDVGSEDGAAGPGVPGQGERDHQRRRVGCRPRLLPADERERACVRAGLGRPPSRAISTPCSRLRPGHTAGR
jgi:hypothetical protein